MLWLVPPLTELFDPPSFLIWVITNDDALSSASASVSLSWVTPLDAVETVKVASSLTDPVSFVAEGASLTPVTVIVKFAVSVPPLPSEIV